MVKILIVGVGGFIGAVCRYLLSGAAQRLGGGTFPAGTLVVNVLGCLAIGMAMTFVTDRPLLSSHARLFLMIGLLGSFTTFSTFGYETVELLGDGEFGPAIWNMGGNILLGLMAVILGRLIAKAAGI